jgi:hypothetical protein
MKEAPENGKESLHLHRPMERHVTDFMKIVRIIVHTFICLKKRHHLVNAEEMEGRDCLS